MSKINMGLFIATTATVVAGLSYLTTVRLGEDDWPPADLRVRVLDDVGMPVEGATFSLLRGNETASGFQQNFCYSPNWVSNKDGIINVLVKPLRYRVTVWRVLWIVPMEQPSVQFDARISAPGFRPARVPLRTLLDRANSKQNRRVNKLDEAKGFTSDENMVIFEVVVTLER